MRLPVFYNDGNLYTVARDAENYACLYRIAADGTAREKYMRLFRADLSPSENASGEETNVVEEWSEPYICIHRGYVYYIDNRENPVKLRRMKLGGSEAEMVWEMQGERSNIYRMRAYGDYLFFQAGNFTDEDYLEIDGGIFAYNVETGRTQMVKKDAISCYSVAGSDLYYMENNETLHRYSLESQKDAVVMENLSDDGNAWTDVFADEQYIYRVTDGKTAVYDLEGELVCSLDDEIMDFYGFDSSGVYADFSNSNYSALGVVEKEEIAPETESWKMIVY